jgi:hypothetical protein
MPNNSMHLAVDNRGLGMGKAIIFRPDVTSLGAIRDGDVFTVSLSGIRTWAGAPATLQYSINFFDLEREMGRSRVNLTVRHGTTPVSGATVMIGGQALTTDSDGLASLRLYNDRTYDYTVTAAGYSTESGSIAVGADTVSRNLQIYIPVSFAISDTARIYDGTARGVTVSASPDVAFTARYDGSVEVPRNAGTYNVLVETDAYGYTGSTTATLTINKAVLRVAADDKAMTYGDPLPAWTVSYSGFASGDNVSSLTAQPSVTLTTIGRMTAGSHSLVPSGGQLRVRLY